MTLVVSFLLRDFPQLDGGGEYRRPKGREGEGEGRDKGYDRCTYSELEPFTIHMNPLNHTCTYMAVEQRVLT